MQLAKQADHLFARQKTPQPAMAAGFFVVVGLFCVGRLLWLGGDGLLDG